MTHERDEQLEKSHEGMSHDEVRREEEIKRHPFGKEAGEDE